MTFLLGSVDNSRRATLQSSLYAGEVGVRDRGNGQVELAWFSRQPKFVDAVIGTLDGAPITITAIRVRPINDGSPILLQANPNRSITATAELAVVVPIA
jgi:hypothetical protein